MLSNVFSLMLKGMAYPSKDLALSFKEVTSALTYILDLPLTFFASCTKLDTGELPSKAITID